MSILKTGTPEPTTNTTSTVQPTKLAAPNEPGGQVGAADAARGEAGAAPSASPAQVDKPEQDLSSRFAALSRKEKKLQETEKAIKELQAKLGPVAEAVEKKDIKKLLALGALDMNDVIQAALKDEDEKPTAEQRVQTVEEKIAAWEKAKEEEKLAAEQAAQQKHYEEEVAAFRKTLSDTLTSKSEQYELIHALGASEQVFEAIREMVVAEPDSFPDRASVEKLIPLIADEIESQLLERAKKFGTANKVKSLFSAALLAEGEKNPQATSQSPKPTQVITRSETLTNKHSAPPAIPQEKPRKLSVDESKAKAAETLRRLLNQSNAAPTA